MAVTTTNLGVITAYGDAVAAGYTGTKAEWQALMASYATVGQQAVDAKNDAVAAKNTAVSKATEATTAASTATTKANEASASAQSIAQSAAQIQENTDDIDQLMSDLTNLQSIEWVDGYIQPNGTIAAGGGTRWYSNLLICPPNTQVKYVSETNHANIAGISFYDMSGAFVGGVANNGTIGEEMTVTSPAMCAFCRLSTKTAIKDSSYYRISTQGIEYIVKSLSPVTKHGLLFFGNGSNRTPYNYNVENIMKVTVTDDDYEIAMTYKKADGTETGTAWYKTINVASFGVPVGFRMRRADNAVIASGTVLDIVDVVRSTDFATIVDLKTTGYVNKSGNDENDGLSKKNALLTISAAIGKGFKNILIGEGVYTESIVIDGISGLHMSLDMSGNSFVYPDSTNNPKVVINGANTNARGITLTNCYNCDFDGIEVRNVTTYAWDIDNCSDIKISDCIVHDIAIGAQTGMGFKVTDSNVDFYNCVAYNIGTTVKGTAAYRIDGFNIHGTGTVNLFDCSAWNCEDDGVSHHDATCGVIDGGEWYNCGKGGVASPTHGAKVNIKNVYSHDNDNGIYAGSDRADIAKTVLVSGCVLKDNSKDIYVSNNTLKVWNCIFDTQTTSGGGSIDIIS